MNFIEEFFARNSGTLSGQLIRTGFSADQAGEFLNAAATSILESFHHREIEEIIAAMGSREPARLLNTINANTLAERLGINAYLVRSGFETIAPLMASAFATNSRGIVGAAASIAWGSNTDFAKLAH